MTNDNYWRDRMIALEKRVEELEERLNSVNENAYKGYLAWSQLQPIGGGLANGGMY